MSAPGNARIEKALEWIRLATDDLRVSEHILEMEEPRPCRLSAFHAQQCVEKCLKAFLVAANIDFPYTHNISTLLELASPMADWGTALDDAESLTVFAVSVRYPSDDDSVTEREARQAIQIANLVRETIDQSIRAWESDAD